MQFKNQQQTLPNESYAQFILKIKTCKNLRYLIQSMQQQTKTIIIDKYYTNPKLPICKDNKNIPQIYSLYI